LLVVGWVELVIWLGRRFKVVGGWWLCWVGSTLHFRALQNHDTLCFALSRYLRLFLLIFAFAPPQPIIVSTHFPVSKRAILCPAQVPLLAHKRRSVSTGLITAHGHFFCFCRVLYGSDFPVTHLRGRCVGVGDSFLWISPGNCDLKAAYAEHGEIQTALVRVI
jgi:hypothetical protein